jgi:hypothetical protein
VTRFFYPKRRNILLMRKSSKSDKREPTVIRFQINFRMENQKRTLRDPNSLFYHLIYFNYL